MDNIKLKGTYWGARPPPIQTLGGPVASPAPHFLLLCYLWGHASLHGKKCPPGPYMQYITWEWVAIYSYILPIQWECNHNVTSQIRLFSQHRVERSQYTSSRNLAFAQTPHNRFSYCACAVPQGGAILHVSRSWRFQQHISQVIIMVRPPLRLS